MRRALLLALLLAAQSCAVATTGSPPSAQRSMSPARAGLRPEYRIFYDALEDHGDWVLVEPFGYLFRPRVGYHDWRPYEYGFWAPTDAFGWVWISSEPFGWATYHYGRWFHDDFHGWLWLPGADWAPAWVSWQMNDRWVGWAPLAPGGGRPADDVPGGAYLFTSVSSLGTTDLASQVRTQTQLGSEVAGVRPVSETAEVDGVRVPAGPGIGLVERMIGQRLQRAKVEDLLAPAPAPATTPEPPPPAAPPTTEETRKAADQAAREARALSGRPGKLPPRVSIVRLFQQRAGGLARPRPAGKDSLRDKGD